MPDPTTPAKGLTQPTVGGDNNTWGGLLNANLALLDTALGGTLALSISGNTTLSTNQAQNSGYRFTGTLSGNATITWPSFYGHAVIRNLTTGGFAITCGISGGASVTVLSGATVSIWSDGTDFIQVSPGHSVFMPEQFGAKGDGTTDDTQAFKDMTTAINKTGGGMVNLGQNKTYRIYDSYSFSGTEFLCSFTATLQFLTWYSNGSSFTIAHTFTPGIDVLDIIALGPGPGTNPVTNVLIDGLTAQQLHPVNNSGGSSYGTCLVGFGNNVTNTVLINPVIVGGLACVIVGASPGLENSTNRMTITGGLAQDCFYGLSAENNGSNWFVRGFRTENCFRDYFVYGVNDHDVDITSRNSISNSLLIEPGGTTGNVIPTSNIHVNYNVLARTIGTHGTSYVSIDMAGPLGTPMLGGIVENIDINLTLDASGDTATTAGYVEVFKNTTSSLGSIIRGCRISFDIFNLGNVGEDAIEICPAADAPWSGETIEGLEITGRGSGSSTPTFRIDGAACPTSSPAYLHDILWPGPLSVSNPDSIDFARCSFNGAAQMALQRDSALLVYARGVNFNAGSTDTTIAVPLPPWATRYRFQAVEISNANHSLTTATCGLFTGPGGTGTALVSGSTACTVSQTADATANNLQIISGSATTTYTAATLYFRVGTPEGASATADVTLIFTPLP